MNRNIILVNIKSLLSKINYFTCILYITLFSRKSVKRCWFIHYLKKHNVTLAMPGSSIYLTIVSMANNTASLKNIMDTFPELSMFDILNALEKGAREGYLNASFGKAMLTSLRDSLLNSSLNESALELAQSTIQNVTTAPIRQLRPINVDGTVSGELPKGRYTLISVRDPITEEIKHVLPSAHLPTPVKESLLKDWVYEHLGIILVSTVVVVGIIYYIYKKHKRTPPEDITDLSGDVDIPTSSNSQSYKSTSPSQLIYKYHLLKIILNLFIKNFLYGSFIKIFLIIFFIELSIVEIYAFSINT